MELTNKTSNGQLADGDEEEDNCQYYCNGLVQDFSVGYRSVHGYISLVVSVFDIREYHFAHFDDDRWIWMTRFSFYLFY